MWPILVGEGSNGMLDRYAEGVHRLVARDLNGRKLTRFKTVITGVLDDDLTIGTVPTFDRVASPFLNDEHLLGGTDHFLVGLGDDLHFRG